MRSNNRRSTRETTLFRAAIPRSSTALHAAGSVSLEGNEIEANRARCDHRRLDNTGLGFGGRRPRSHNRLTRPAAGIQTTAAGPHRHPTRRPVADVRRRALLTIELGDASTESEQVHLALLSRASEHCGPRSSRKRIHDCTALETRDERRPT